jgi:hypothetical protein
VYPFLGYPNLGYRLNGVARQLRRHSMPFGGARMGHHRSKSLLIWVPVLFSFGACARMAAQTPLSTAAIAARATPATVTILTFDALGDTLGQGSGFFFIRPDGTLLTNWHVMAGAYRAHVILASGRWYEQVTVLEADSATDLAILKVSGSGLPAPVPRSTMVPAVGERVVVIGSPLGLSRTVSEGIVSARRLVDGREFVQISAAISPGSSGGPVLDGQGRVFAVAMGTLTEGQQLNFAVPVRYAVLMLLRYDLRILDGPQVERRLDAVFGALAPVKDAPNSTWSIAGLWHYNYSFSSTEAGLSCSSQGTATLHQSGANFTGTATATDTHCTDQTGTYDYTGVQQISGGQISGITVSFQMPGCRFTGTMSGSPANQMRGRQTCTFASSGSEYEFAGSWQASR